jgi:hypothetical protein
MRSEAFLSAFDNAAFRDAFGSDAFRSRMDDALHSARSTY